MPNATIEYSYSDVPTIRGFSRSRNRIRGLMGPFGSGKSSGCVIDLARMGSEQAPSLLDGVRRTRYAVVRNTYRQLQDTTIKTVFQWLPPELFGRYNKSDQTYLVTKLDENLEIELMFRALDRDEHVSNLLSMELSGAWINEARELPWSIVRAIYGRIGRFPAVDDGGCTNPCLIMDTNPPDDESWWYTLFENKLLPGTKDRSTLDAKLFRQPSGLSDKAENKTKLPENYYEDLAKQDEAFVKVYVHGKYGYVQDGLPVYPEYNDSLHCQEDIGYAPGVPIYRGWDFGLTPACVLSQMLPTGQWVTFREFTTEFGESLSIDALSDTVILECSKDYPDAEFIDIGDPAGNSRAGHDARSCFMIMQGKGIRIRPGEQSPKMRQESVKWALSNMTNGAPRLLVSPACHVLRKGYAGSYHYKRIKVAGAAERYTDAPDKNMYSHVHDANQYVAVHLFGDLVRNKVAKEESKPVQNSVYVEQSYGWMM